MNTPNRRILASTVTAVSLAAVVAGVAVAQPSSDPTDTDTGSEVEEQEPALDGSIQVPEDETATEDDENAQLAQLDGLISQQDAIDAAGGTADHAELGNENGSVIWEVEVTAPDGTVEEVKVDAGNGDILARENEADDESEADEDENENENDVEDDDGVEHQNEGEEGEHSDE